MIFRSNVNKDKDKDEEAKVFSWWQMLIFVLLIFGIFILLFPKKLFIYSVVHNTKVSRVSISYLRNLLAKDPTNVELKVILAEQDLQIGEIKEAESLVLPYVTFTPSTELQWRILWVDYRVQRIKFFAIKNKQPANIAKQEQLNRFLPVLKNSPYLDADQQADLADDALAFNKPEIATYFYKSAINKHVKRPPKFFAKAGMAALFIHDYEDSAVFYILAMQKSLTLEKKRLYFIKGIRSLNAAGLAEPALKFAQKNIDGLINDKNTLVYMTKLALLAGELKVAEEYVNRVLQIKYRD